jgi:hypothetical protein
MKILAVLVSSLLITGTASAQSTTRYDLICKNKVTIMRIGSASRETVSSPKRLSIDLTSKLWCSRHDDMSCGITSPITITSTQLVLNEFVFIDRRSGRMTMESGAGEYSSFSEYTCTKAPFTSLPAVKF